MPQNTLEQEREIERKRDTIKRQFLSLFQAIDKYFNDASDGDVKKMHDYLHRYGNNYRKERISKISLETARIIELIFYSTGDARTTEQILTYLESVEYGWQGKEYNLNNTCLQHLLYDPRGHCKRIISSSYVEQAKEVFTFLGNLFFTDFCGRLTLFIFNYCIAGLFSSRFRSSFFPLPFYLQIACDRHSTLYKLILEIAEICNVNAGIIEHCNDRNHNYGCCGYLNTVFYPTQSTAKDIDELTGNNRDVTIVVSGHENERYYNSMLREVSNINHKMKPLGEMSRFHILPLFVCPEIKSSFDNVIDMDLTAFDVRHEQLALLRENKKLLASYVLDFVMRSDEYLNMEMNKANHRVIHSHNNKISAYSTFISRNYATLTLDCSRNVGLLNFFFKGFLRAVRRSFTFNYHLEFSILERDGVPLVQNTEKNVCLLSDYSERALVELHQFFLPAPISMDNHDKEAVRLAKLIEQHYRALKVMIRVTPTDSKEDRFVFAVDSLHNTKDTDVSRNAETVQRRLKKYEYFRVDLRDKTAIKIVVAVNPPNDNSLIDILNHKDFINSKMKIPYAVGFDDTGSICIEDICDFPHLLLGGATQSGKSTAMMSLLTSIAYKHRSGDVNVVIMDLLGQAKSDYDIFNHQPFLACPIINSPSEGLMAISRLYMEMNSRLRSKNLSAKPYIVCVIDEFPRLFTDINDKKNKEILVEALNQLSSRGRHQKIHLVLAAQNPIKKHMVFDTANFPAKMAFRCAHYQNSVVLLGGKGAEKLLGKGQMIFNSPSGDDKRLQGSYITKEALQTLLCGVSKTFKQTNEYPFIISGSDLTYIPAESYNDSSSDIKPSHDDILPDVIIWALAQERIANRRIQKEFQVGNDRTEKLLHRMAELNLVKRLHGNLGWQVVPRKVEDVTTDVKRLLETHGYSEADVEMAINKMSGIVTAQVAPTKEHVDDSIDSAISSSPNTAIADERAVVAKPLPSPNEKLQNSLARMRQISKEKRRQ